MSMVMVPPTTPFIRTRLKLCGLTRPEDITPMVQSGADAIGMVFYPPSKRSISAAQAAKLCADIPAFVSTVGLFVNPRPADVKQVVQLTQMDLLQFHGDESPEFCRSFQRPYIKAFRVGAPGLTTAEALLAECRRFDDAKGWLFDSYTPAYGGSGVPFDLDVLLQLRTLCTAQDAPIILAGGLTIENINEKITQLQPYAVDVSSGIELSPGIKCPTKIASFVRHLYGTVS